MTNPCVYELYPESQDPPMPPETCGEPAEVDLCEKHAEEARSRW